MKDQTLIALGLHYEDLASELRAEIIRTAENNQAPTREDFVADIARRFTTMGQGEASELLVVWVGEGDKEIDDPLTVDPEGEPPHRALKCPHCESVNVDVREVDIAERWNIAEPEIDKDNLVLAYGGDCGDFEHDHYECDSCSGHVTLPASLTEHESWS